MNNIFPKEKDANNVSCVNNWSLCLSCHDKTTKPEKAEAVWFGSPVADISAPGEQCWPRSGAENLHGLGKMLPDS